MTVVRPFRAVHYDTTRCDLTQVIVPPYDVVAADERGRFFDRDPHNAIRFELTRDVQDEASTDYAWVRETFDAWRESGVLTLDPEPGYYVMRQRFESPEGGMLERIGFFGELGLEEYDARVVRPHERTLAGPKADRLKLLRASRANLSCVFLLYEDREQRLAEPLAKALSDDVIGHARDDAGVEYTLARITDPTVNAEIEAFMAERPTVIADGHHRYETALEYAREQRAASQGQVGRWASTLAFFANAYAPGSLLLPIHRVVREVPAPSVDEWRRRLPGWSIEALAVSRSEEGIEGLRALLADRLAPLGGKPAFLADDGSGTALLVSKDEPLGERLMVRIVEGDVLGGVFGLDVDAIRGGAVSFPKSAERAAREVRDGQGTVALYLNPLSPDDVFRVTAEGEVMPQKSTFFYPKVPTGMVFRDHDEADA